MSMTMNNRNRMKWGAALLFSLCAAFGLQAKVKLPALIADGMVLQREQPVKVWGTADAGERVELSFVKASDERRQSSSLPVALKGGRLKSVYATTADGDGRWTITLPALKAGGPYRIRVNDLSLADVWIGDVWLCSGQSNMELPVSRVTDRFAEEVASYANEHIRQITIPKVYDFHAPQQDIPAASWKPLTPDNAMSFSALAYFFAKAAYARAGVPIGLIHASWGGTPVEAWISEEGLKEFPLYVNDKRRYEDDTYCEHIKKLESEHFARWNRSLYLGDAGLHESLPWYAPDYDDGAWKTVDMFSGDWGTNGLNPIGGSHWLRKTVTLPAHWEGQEATLRLGCIVDADSVYVNGRFVGTTSYQYPPRVYAVPPGVLKAGRNNVTVRIISNGGRPHFVREKPYKIICRGEEVGLEGDWRYRLGAPMPHAPSMMFFCYKPVGLYNAMIAPLRHCAFRGVLWYQGESNVGRRNEYAALLTAMIADWRNTFANPGLPFYIVELADFLPEEDTGGRAAWAEMRREQARAAGMNTNTTLIRNSDVGEWNDIHPLDKKTPGERIAAAAYR